MKKLLVAILLMQATAFAQTGRTVTGSVTPAPGAAAAAARAVRVAIVSSGTPAQTLEAVVEADGTFRFSNVPRGPYIARLLPINNNFRSETPYPVEALFVGDRDVTGLQLSGPDIVMGRVMIEGGGRLPLSALNPRPELATLGNIQIRPAGGRGSSSFLTSGVRVDHSFVVAVPSGEYNIAATFPANFSVRSITYGNVNLLQGPLKVSGASSTEIVVTLAQSAGFAVRGRVTGRPAGPMPLGVAVTTPGASAIVNADGTFELRAIPPGSRAITLARNGASPLSGQTTSSRLTTANITVVDKDIENVELAWTPMASLTGQLLLLDKSNAVIPGIPPGATVTVTSRDGKALAGGCDTPRCRADILSLFPQPNGSLNAAYPRLVPPTVADVAVTQLPPGYFVKTITSGTLDLLQNPLRIDATTDTIDIQVVVQNTSGARVAGRVITSPEASLIPQRVSLVAAPGITPGTRQTVQTAVASDGTFQFGGVAPGVYTLTSDPFGLATVGSTTTNVIVRDQDVADIPLVGLSDEQIPNTIQYANEAAAVLNIGAIQQAQIYYNGLIGRYGSLDELIASGSLSSGYARANSGYTITFTSSGTDILGAALPVTAADGRYEFYFSRNGGARAMRLTGAPATSPRTVVLNTLEQASTCGSDVPLCLRFGPPGQPRLNVQGRLSVVAGPGGFLTLPPGVFVGAVSSTGTGALTSLRDDGAFQLALPSRATEHRVSIQNLPAGYTVRSIQSNGRDLPNGVFTSAVPLIEVTIESRGPQTR
jgi:hypothetical protein